MSEYSVSVAKFSRTAKVLDVLKIIPLTDKKRCGHHGNVSFHLDSNIYKNVCQILGRVAASNKVVLPQRPLSGTHPSKGEVRSLRLSERYLYLQLCKIKGRQCTMHFDLTTHRQVTINVSVSTIYKEVKVSNHSINMPLAMSDKWTILCLDFVEILDRYFPNEVLRYIKRITLCSNMLVCGIFTSDTRFNYSDVPRQIALLRRNGKRWLDQYSWRNVPELVGGVLQEDMAALEQAARDGGGGGRRQGGLSYGSREAGSAPGTPKPRDFAMVVSRVGSNPNGRRAVHTPDNTGRRRTGVQASHLALTQHPQSTVSTSVVAKVLRGSNYSSSQIARSFAARSGSPTKKVRSNVEDPAVLALDRVVAVTPCRAAGAWWLDKNRTAVFPSGNLIVLQSLSPSAAASSASTSNSTTGVPIAGSQRYLKGHTSPVIALCVGGQRGLVVSAQGGPVPSIRVWDSATLKCLAIILAPSSGVHCLSLSDDETQLCVAGTDEHNRHQLFVWDISNVDGSSVDGGSAAGGGVVGGTGAGFFGAGGPAAAAANRSARKSPPKQHSPGVWAATIASAAKLESPYTLAAKQVSEFPIHRISFLPGSTSELLSCGHENVRLWRIRERHLRGRPVVLQPHMRRLDFLDLSFERSRAAALLGGASRNVPRAFIASSSGEVVIVDTRSTTVTATFKVHDDAITALCVNEGYCVTASDDRTLKVWPLDFSDFFLQAPHDGRAARVSISDNGLQVLVDSELGTLGVLHIASQRFVSIMRSHSAVIHAVAHNPRRPELATTADDHTIRVWDLSTMAQLYEFTLSGYQCRCLTFDPSGSNHLICGFDSGHVRVLDVSNTSLVKELKESSSPIACVVSLPDGSRFFSLDTDGVLCTFLCSGSGASATGQVVEGGGYRFGQKTSVFPAPSPHASVRQPQDMSLAVSANSRVLAVACSDAQKVLLLWADSLDVLSYLSCPANFSIGAGFTALAFDESGTSVSAATMSRGIVTWSVADSSVVRHLPNAHNQRCSAFGVKACAPAGGHSRTGSRRTFATADLSGMVSTWTTPVGQKSTDAEPVRQQFIGHNGPVTGLAMADTGGGSHTFVVSVGGNQIFRWYLTEEIDHEASAPDATAQEALVHALRDAADGNVSEDDGDAATVEHLENDTENSDGDGDGDTNESETDDGDQSWTARRAAQQHQQRQTERNVSSQNSALDGQFVDLVSTINKGESGESLDLSRPGESSGRLVGPRAPAPSSGVSLTRRALVGYSGSLGNHNLLWNQQGGLILSSCGSVLVAEDVSTSAQFIHDTSADKDSAGAAAGGGGAAAAFAGGSSHAAGPSSQSTIRGIATSRDCSMVVVESIPTGGPRPFRHTTLSLYHFHKHGGKSTGTTGAQAFELQWSGRSSCVGAPLSCLDFSHQKSATFLLYALGGCGIFVKDVASGGTIGTVFLTADSDVGVDEPVDQLLVRWLSPTTFVRVHNGTSRQHTSCFAELWDVGGSNALQLTKRPYRVQLDLSLRRPGVAFACAIDTYVTFEGEDKLVVGTSDGVINMFSDVSQAECPGAEGDTGHGFVHALQSSTASVVRVEPTSVFSVLAPLLGSPIGSPRGAAGLGLGRQPPDHIRGIRWCRNGMFLVSAGSSLYRVSTERTVERAAGSPRAGLAQPSFKKVDFDDQVVAFSFGIDADRGVVSTTAGTLWFVEWSAGSLVRLTSSHSEGVRDLKSIPATPHRPGLVCSAGGADGSIRIWAASRPVAIDPSSGFSLQQLIQFEVPRASCTAVTIREVGGTASGAGGTVFSAAGYSDGTVRVFNVTDISVLQKFALATGAAEVTAIGIVALPHAATAEASGYAVVVGTHDGHIICSPLSGAASSSPAGSYDGGQSSIPPPPVEQIVLVQGQVASGATATGGGRSADSSPGAIVCIETAANNAAQWLACNTAGHLSVWNGDEVRHHVLLESIVDEARRAQNSRPSSFGRHCVTFSPVDADVVLVSANSVPPLVVAYHLDRKAILYTMPLAGWPQALDFFVAPAYAAPFVALVGVPTATEESASSQQSSRIVSLLDLQSGKEIMSSRQHVQVSGDGDGTSGMTLNRKISVVFGCNASPHLPQQTLTVGIGKSLHVFASSKGRQ